MSFDRLGVALGLALLGLAAPAGAIENQCATDADCGSGLGCVEQSYVECTGSAGGAGGEGGGVFEEECTTTVYRACLPKPCATNADCTGGTSCVAFTYETCSGGGDVGGAGGEPGTGTGGRGGSASGGAGGDAGGAPPPYECETVTESWCVPPWLAPCELDADCGPGFRCVVEDPCDAPPDPDGGGAGGYGGSPCAPSDVKHCELVVTACASSADCGPGLVCENFEEWICEDAEEPPPPPGGEGGAGGDGGYSGGAGGGPGTGGRGGDTGSGGYGGEAGGGAPDDPDCWTDTTSLCVPPGFVDWMFAYGPTRGGDQAGGGGYGGGAEGAGGASAPADDDGRDADTGGGLGLGCQASGGGLSLLALLGVALALRRR